MPEMTLGERLWEAQRAARPERVIGFVQASSDARLKRMDFVSPLATVWRGKSST